MSHWDSLSENLLKPYNASQKKTQAASPAVTEPARKLGAATIDDNGVVIVGAALPKSMRFTNASAIRAGSAAPHSPSATSTTSMPSRVVGAGSTSVAINDANGQVSVQYEPDHVKDSMFPRETSIFRAHDASEQELNVRIVRRDNRILDETLFGARYVAVEHKVKEMIQQIGADHVVEVEIHKNALIKLNRVGKPVLQGVRFTLHANAPIWRLSADYGRCAAYTSCTPMDGANAAPSNGQIEDALNYNVFDPHTGSGSYLDESTVTPSQEYYNTWRLRTPLRMDQNMTLASKAYDCCLTVVKGAIQGHSDHIGIYADNHDPDAVVTAERIMTQKRMTVAEFWASEPYFACMTYGGMQAAAMTKVLADAASLRVPQFEYKFNERNEGSPVQLTIADLTYYAPMTFITPIKCNKIVLDGQMVDCEEYTAYQVNIGVMGDYCNAVPDVGRTQAGLMRTSMSIRAETVYGTKHVGYPYLYGPTAAVGVIVPLMPKFDRDAQVTYPMFWRMARQIGLDRVKMENDSTVPPTGIVRCSLLASHVGIPTTGIYLGESAKTSDHANSKAYITGNTAFYRISHNYTALSRAGKALEESMRRLQYTLLSSDPNGPNPMVLEYRGEVKFCMAGSLNPEGMRLPAFLETISRKAFVYVPMRNHTVVLQIIALATMVHNAIEFDGMDDELREIHQRIMQKMQNETLSGYKSSAPDQFLGDLTNGAVYYSEEHKRLFFYRNWLKYAYAHFNPTSPNHERARPIVPHNLAYYTAKLDNRSVGSAAAK